MSEVSCYDIYGNSINHLTQWDINQTMYIDWLYDAAPSFHFCNVKSEKALVVKGEIVDGKAMCKIPNILLQEPYTIAIFVYYENGSISGSLEEIDSSGISGRSIYTCQIPVRKRPKPDDYEYENNIEYLSWVKLEQELIDRIANLDQTVIDLVDGHFEKCDANFKELEAWTFTSTGLRKKNLLKNEAVDKTFDCVVSTVNTDGSISIAFTDDETDTATSTLRAFEINTITLDKGQYIISGCPAGGSSSTYNLQVIDTETGAIVARDTGDGAIFTASEEKEYTIQLCVSMDTEADELVFFPMIRNAAITDSEYEQYVHSLKDSLVGRFYDNVNMPDGEIFNDYENNVASGVYSHAEGNVTTASSASCHAEGYTTVASAMAAHAEGGNTLASGMFSHAEGQGVTASGLYSHAEGGGTIASGQGSHAEGAGTTASGNYSHAEGYGTYSSGLRSHTSGNNTQALGEDQFVIGKYNLLDDQSIYAFIVGNGDNDVRSNAFTLDWDGNLWVKGDVFIGNGSTGNVTSIESLMNTISGLVPEDSSIQEVIDARTGYFSDYTFSSLNQRLNAEFSACVRQNTMEKALSSAIQTAIDTAAITYWYDANGVRQGAILYGEESQAHNGSAIALGGRCITTGEYAVAEGLYTCAYGDYQHVFGKYNIEDPNSQYVLIVGNGVSTARQANIYTLDWDGNGWFAGNVMATNKEGSSVSLCGISALTASTLGTPLKKNLLPYPASVAKGGITFTFDSNGYMTASETSADGRQWTAVGSQYSVKLRAGTYILSFVSSTACTNAYGNIMVLDADSTKIADIGQKNYAKQQSGSVEFTLDTDQTVYVMAKIFDGTTGIMLRHADITDGAYEPYTKSIQEQLDELKAQIAAMTTAAATTETEE